ncbi:MAG: DUF924 domain-containing protein [Verrucomicrobia bacterium]|nr:DUF924 domain-containing protein [Verrucomicrobiota bacterium]
MATIIAPEDVLEFWFADALSSPAAFKARMGFWYGSSPETDETVRTRFSLALESAAQGLLDSWKAQPASLLALIILLDQFPRNIYRGSAAAFVYDRQALQYCLEGIRHGVPQKLHVGQRQFYYLPLQHAEDLDLQVLSVGMYSAIVDDSPPDFAPIMQAGLDYAIQHRGIIETFGRFPHRNDALNRKSSPAELSYLKTAERFGQ